jgi:peptide deformylase
LTVLVNPQLRSLGDETISVMEGCLSVPNLRGRVERSAHVEVRAYTAQGEPFTLIAEGLTAGTLQHELDHLDGLLFIDRITDSSTLCSSASYNQFIAADFAQEAVRINARYPKRLETLQGHGPKT